MVIACCILAKYSLLVGERGQSPFPVSISDNENIPKAIAAAIYRTTNTIALRVSRPSQDVNC